MTSEADFVATAVSVAEEAAKRRLAKKEGTAVKAVDADWCCLRGVVKRPRRSIIWITVCFTFFWVFDLNKNTFRAFVKEGFSRETVDVANAFFSFFAVLFFSSQSKKRFGRFFRKDSFCFLREIFFFFSFTLEVD